MRFTTWTPDKLLLLLKEVVSALFGILVVGAAVWMAHKTLSSDAERFADAKDVLNLAYGLAGVVLGHYFGRIPADARTAQAQDQAQAAAASAAEMGAKVHQAVMKMDNMVKELEAMPAGMVSSGGEPAALAEVQGMKDFLKELRAVIEAVR